MSDHDPTDVDRLLGALRGPPPPALPPELPNERPAWQWPGLAMAAAVLIAFGAATLSPSRDPRVTRGGGSSGPEVELRVVIDDGGRAQRVRRSQSYPIGQQVFFGVAADPGAGVSLWVDGPEGRETVTRVEAGPTLETLNRAFLLDQAGTWTFTLAAAPVGVCPPQSCSQVTVRVR